MSERAVSLDVPPPAEIPIFPLHGVLLLPRGQLPLNVFEPRYLRMVLDALGNGRVIGMIQTRAAEPHPVPDGAALFPVGCAGRISAFAETADGRLLITLSGIGRFRVGRELDRAAGGYRRVVADYAAFAPDREPPTGRIADRARLLAAVRGFFADRATELDWKAVESASDDALVTSLAMLCPLAGSEKQALLEASDLAERATLLTTMLEMAGRAPRVESSTARH